MPRNWKITVVASAKVNGGTLWVSSQLANLEIAPALVLGKIAQTSVEQGQPVKVVCQLDQKTPFEGKATVKLIGLPSSTTATDAEITKDSKEAVFNVTTTANSPVGLQKGIFCSLTVEKNGEPITQTLGNGGVLRIDAPRLKVADAKATAKAPAGKATPASNKKDAGK